MEPSINSGHIDAFVKAATICPDSYAYFGERPKYKADASGELWGDTGITKHRDSDAIGRSNFNTIFADLNTRFPGVFEIEGGGHWAVGWYETVIMQIDKRKGTRNKRAIVAILAWKNNLDAYPVADENDMNAEEEKDGGRCGYCGEMGHHDCNECKDKSLETYEEYEDSDGALVCHNCGDTKSDHEPRKDSD